MNLHIFTTGERSPYWLSMVPVIKVRKSLAEGWGDLIDLGAGRIQRVQAALKMWDGNSSAVVTNGERKEDAGGILGIR